MKTRVLIHLDDNSALRTTIKEVFEGLGQEVLSFGSFTDLKKALASLKEKALTRNYVGLFDVRLSSEDSGITAFREIRKDLIFPIIFLSGEANLPEAITALKEGAHDFLLKPVDLRDLIHHVAKAFDNNPLPLPANTHITDEDYEGLTPRERQVIELIAQGLRGSQISKRLNITERTVKMHRGNLGRKLNAKNLAHLAAMFEGYRRSKLQQTFN